MQRDDEPTVVTKLFDELRAEKEKTRESLNHQKVEARKLRRSLRSRKSVPGLHVPTEEEIAAAKAAAEG